MVFGKEVRVELDKRDRYKRIVGKVWVQPADCPTCPMTLDAGHAQITVGMGVVVSEIRERATPRGSWEPTSSAEQEAKAKRVGLWSDA